MSGPVVCDTSVFVDHLRGDERASEALAGLSPEECFGSVLTRIELMVGAHRHRRATETLAAAVRWIPVSDEIATIAAGLALEFGPSHAGIDAVDYSVAATAIHLEASLWTRNVRHFPMLAGLEPPY